MRTIRVKWGNGALPPLEPVQFTAGATVVLRNMWIVPDEQPAAHAGRAGTTPDARHVRRARTRSTARIRSSMDSVSAIFHKGVLSPIGWIDAPKGSEIVAEAEEVSPEAEAKSMATIYRIMSKRFRSGEHDVAARHNMHHP